MTVWCVQVVTVWCVQVHGDCVVCAGGVVNVWCVQVHGDWYVQVVTVVCAGAW